MGVIAAPAVASTNKPLVIEIIFLPPCSRRNGLWDIDVQR
jgi:hypothetical protein